MPWLRTNASRSAESRPPMNRNQIKAYPPQAPRGAGQHEGFDRVMEAIAYTWFNRLVAIRYMELHGYLDHGFQVLSHPEGRNTPEIVEHAEEVELPGLRRETVIDLKLAGNRESELYRKLLIGQCNA